MNHPSLQKDTPAWILQVWISFVFSMILMCVGIYSLPSDFWVKGYLIMGLFFTVGSSFTLAKTVRDNHESEKIINRITEAKTEKMLSELELK